MGNQTTVTVGVDTHADVPVAAVLDQTGRLLDTQSFPTTTRGYAKLATWAESFGTVDKVGMGGTGSYGSGLLRFLTEYGFTVVEVDRSHLALGILRKYAAFMPDQLTVDVWEAVGAVSAQLRLRFADGGGADLGFVALATLRHLVRHGQSGVTDLACRERVTTQAISLRVAPLIAAGLVHRSVDPADGRRSLLEVTPAGRKIVHSAERGALGALGNLIANLSGAERAALTTALPVLHRLGADLAREKP